MSESPLVSVVMSVRNGERYLEKALESVLGQEGVPIEVVAIDDGSTDRTSTILDRARERDPRVRVIRQTGAGLTRALITGCAAARGVYIARQDDDDLSAPGRLAALAAVLEGRPDVVVAGSWAESIGPEGEPLGIATYPEGAEAGTKALLREHRNPVHAAVMYRRRDYEAVGGYRPEFYYAQDADLWLRLVDRGGFFYVPEVLYRFRVVDGSISASRRDAQRRLQELARACRAARIAGESEEVFLAEAAQIRPGGDAEREESPGRGSYFVARCLLRDHDPRAMTYLRRYLRQAPLDPRGWISLLQAGAQRLLDPLRRGR